MKRIAIGGVYYGLHNIGDEAILSSMLNSFLPYGEVSVSTYGSDWIRDKFPQAERRMITANYGRPRFGLYVVPKRRVFTNWKKVCQEIQYYREHDVYICGGATILSDCPWYSLRTVELAGKAGLPVCLWGVGMAETEDVDALKYIRRVLCKPYVRRIFVRDGYVRERLQRLGVDSDKLSVSYDPAIMITGEPFQSDRLLRGTLKEHYADRNRNIVISISGEADVVAKTPLEVIKEAVCRLQKTYCANIFLIPTGCGEHCRDTECMEMLARKVNCDRVHVITEEFSPSELVYFLEGVDLIISSRLHMNILGVCAGVPSIGLVRNQKITDFANLMGFPYLELDTLTADRLTHLAGEMLERKAALRSAISHNLKEMRDAYQDALELLKGELGG